MPVRPARPLRAEPRITLRTTPEYLQYRATHEKPWQKTRTQFYVGLNTFEKETHYNLAAHIKFRPRS